MDNSIGRITALLDLIKSNSQTKEIGEELLAIYTYLSQNKLPIPKELKHFIDNALKEVSEGKKNLMQAFGFSRSKAQPKKEQLHISYVVKIYESILDGHKLDNAIEIVAEKLHRGKTTVFEAYQKYKEEGFNQLRIERILNNEPLSDHQLSRIKDIIF